MRMPACQRDICEGRFGAALKSYVEVWPKCNGKYGMAAHVDSFGVLIGGRLEVKR